MFVAQGLTDPRVPPWESEQIVEALRRHGIPVEYVTIPDEGHGFLKRQNRRTVYAGVLGFLARHMLDRGDRAGDGSGTAPPPHREKRDEA